MLILWTTKSFHTMGTTTVSLFGLVMLLILNIATWNQLVKNYKAWDTLIWLGGLLTLATGLKNNGFISWISEYMNTSFGWCRTFYSINFISNNIFLFYVCIFNAYCPHCSFR